VKRYFRDSSHLPYPDAAALVVLQGEKDFSSGPRIMTFSARELDRGVRRGVAAFSSNALADSTGMNLRSDWTA
jgi:hypothetical protein